MGDDASGRQIRKTLAIVAELLRGEPVDRHAAAHVAKIEPPAAWTQLVQIKSHLAGVREVAVPGKRSKHMRFDLAGQLGKTPRATLVGACLGMSMATLFEKAAYGPAMRDAFARLLASAEEAPLFKDHDRKFAFLPGGGEPALERSPEVLDEVIAALVEGQRLRLHVDHVHEPVAKRTVEPLSLLVHQHQLYLVGREVTKTRRAEESLRAIRVSRVVFAKRLRKTFKYPSDSDYSIRRLFKDVFGMYLRHDEAATPVRVRITGRWAKYARTHRWHHSQRLLDSGQDWVLIELTVRPCPEVESWILGLGRDATVEQPEALRERVARQIEDMASRVSAEHDDRRARASGRKTKST